MIKILQIGLGQDVGGIEKFILNHCQLFDKTQFHFDFINVNEHLALEDDIKAMGSKIYTVEKASKNPLKNYIQLKKIIENNDYDIIHINLPHMANLLSLLAAGNRNVILHSHNSYTQNKIKICLNNINRFLLQNVNVKRIACSQKAGNWLFGNAPFEIVENAIDAEKYKYDEEKRIQIRNQFNISHSSYVIGNVGRLALSKNQEFLIRAFSKYYEQNNNSYLLIVGEGNRKEYLTSLSEQLGIQKNVLFTGFKDNVTDYYSAMDLFCLPSTYEGLGIVGIEAQMSGLPCIFSTNCAEEVDISGNSQFLTLEEEKWVNAFSSTSEKKQDRSTGKVPENYDIKKNVKKLEKIYVNCIDSKKNT